MRVYESIFSNQTQQGVPFNLQQNAAATPAECLAPAGAIGQEGAAGATGSSAYQIALQNGFVGTEQEWLNSLIGPPGQDGITLTTIPYYMKEFMGTVRSSGGNIIYTVTPVGFSSAVVDELIPDNFGLPISFTVTEFDNSIVAAFSSPYNFTIKSLAFSSIGGGELPEIPLNITLAIFKSAQGSNVYTIIPESIFALNPQISSPISETFNVDGEISLNIPVNAGEKIVVGAYLVPTIETENFIDVEGQLMGSMVIELN
ncbi:MAG: hypothetical protein ACOX6H_04260 [Christensenellales bacterium]|jgi:hypothetical protein